MLHSSSVFTTYLTFQQPHQRHPDTCLASLGPSQWVFSPFAVFAAFLGVFTTFLSPASSFIDLSMIFKAVLISSSVMMSGGASRMMF